MACRAIAFIGYEVSIQLMSPASGDLLQLVYLVGLTIPDEVSIQLMSPASGDQTNLIGNGDKKKDVSIQLMSPASGDIHSELHTTAERKIILGFHSINVPSEWGPTQDAFFLRPISTRFHSINVPSEWGLYNLFNDIDGLVAVSIQLMSPASGD